MKAHKHEDYNEDTRLALLEQSINTINQTLNRFEKILDKIDSDMKSGFKDINNRLWTNFFWMIGGFSTLLALMAHAVHWI